MALLVRVDKSVPIRGVRDKISRLLQEEGRNCERAIKRFVVVPIDSVCSSGSEC